jgi:hypothetical protein
LLINFCCNNDDCKNSIEKYFTKAKDIPPFLECGSCGVGKLERILGAPASKSVQYLDNGMQARAVEVNSEVVLKEVAKHNLKDNE